MSGNLTKARRFTLDMISRSPSGKPIYDLTGHERKAAQWLLDNHLIMTAQLRGSRYVATEAGLQALKDQGQ